MRRLCPHCKQKKWATREEKRILRIPAEQEVEIYEPSGCNLCNYVGYFEPSGCNLCNYVGYFGRIAIFEIMEVNEKIRSLITKNASTEELIRCARQSGMRTLRENGILSVLNGTTSVEEVLRASYEHD